MVSIGQAAGEPRPACYVRSPVYDAKGDHLDFRVVAINMDQDNGVDLLHSQDPARKVRAEGEIIYFPKSLLRSHIQVTLENSKGTSFKEQIMLVNCGQRNSLRYGQVFDGFDVAASTITGHLSGCQFTGDWWVRAMPMFGGPGSAWAYEGNIGRDGNFSISGNMPGVRHMVVVGKDKQPIKVFAVDVTVGLTRNDTGTFDLSGPCPK